MTTFERVMEHYEESLLYFQESQIVGIFLQGSQNYKLDLPTSDVDTKLIVVPSFKNICLNTKPVSTTHIRANDEHIDFKDVRLYIDTFYKQNLNFLEILFTPYFYVNPMYAEQWKRLEEARENIARMNPVRGIKSMYGIALEKYHALEHRYPSKIAIIDNYGYDPKQLSHLARVRIYMEHYLNEELYAECLIPKDKEWEYIMNLKSNILPLSEARDIAAHEKELVEKLYAPFRDAKAVENPKMRVLLEDVSYNIMKIAVENELHG